MNEKKEFQSPFLEKKIGVSRVEIRWPFNFWVFPIVLTLINGT